MLVFVVLLLDRGIVKRTLKDSFESTRSDTSGVQVAECAVGILETRRTGMLAFCASWLGSLAALANRATTDEQRVQIAVVLILSVFAYVGLSIWIWKKTSDIRPDGFYARKRYVRYLPTLSGPAYLRMIKLSVVVGTSLLDCARIFIL